MRCINPLTGAREERIVDDGKNNPNRLGYTPQEIASLPTVTQVIDFMRREESAHKGYTKPQIIDAAMMRPIALRSMESPSREFHLSDVADGMYVCKRLQSGRYSLKPNLTHRPWLYRGQNEVFPSVKSSFGLLTRRSQRVEANVRFAEFQLLLSSHPLFRLFDSGISLEGMDAPVFFEMNYYGLGQHYGVKTDLLDFSSEIDVSAFFATTRWLAPHSYKPVDCRPGSYGVIYSIDINPHDTFAGQGFSTIGLQVYPRTGCQKGFCYSPQQAAPTYADINRNAAMVAFPFRHDAAANAQVFDRWKGGALLFPADELQPLAEEIRLSDRVSLDAFAYNMYVNPRDEEAVNRQELADEGLTVDPHLRRQFTPDTLKSYYSDIRNGWWEQFCSQIYFGDLPEEKLMAKAMFDLPSNPAYRHYFDPGYWRLLNYHRADSLIKASRR